MGKGRKPKTHGNGYEETNPPDMEFVIVVTNGVTFNVRAKTPHLAIVMFCRQEPELASHIEAIGQENCPLIEFRGLCRRCGHAVLDRSDERPVPAPGGGIHCGECGANSRAMASA